MHINRNYVKYGFYDVKPSRNGLIETEEKNPLSLLNQMINLSLMLTIVITMNSDLISGSNSN